MTVEAFSSQDQRQKGCKAHLQSGWEREIVEGEKEPPELKYGWRMGWGGGGEQKLCGEKQFIELWGITWPFTFCSFLVFF